MPIKDDLQTETCCPRKETIAKDPPAAYKQINPAEKDFSRLGSA